MSKESHYFIKFNNNKTVDENIEKLKGLKFNFNNTVGPKSISKQELIKQFNVLINEDEEGIMEENEEDDEDFLDEDEYNNFL
jgi:uncharacterized protein YlbG (UPF0298 family)